LYGVGVHRFLLPALVLTLVPGAAAAPARELPLPGPLSALSVSNATVAYANMFRTRCHEIRVWGHDDRSNRRIASHCFADTSTGSGVAGVISTYGRSLWLTYTGGNVREWSLWTKGYRAPARRITLRAADVDGPPPMLLGRIWEGSLPYAIGRTIVVLDYDGSRRFTLTVSDRIVALSAHSGGYAALLANGQVVTLSQAGKHVKTHAYDPGVAQEAVLTRQGLVVKTTAGLDVHAAGTVRTLPLPRGAKFFGLTEGLVAYGTARELRLLRLATGRDSLFRTFAPGFRAALARRGLAYASGRTLGFATWSQVNAATR
jgi:hypothetical protein